MAQLAIKGHATRGKEVIEILEMLGGKNKYNLRGSEDEWFVLNGILIQRSDRLFAEKGFSLEEFLEKFPYKVGDKVCYIKYNDEYPSIYIIKSMRWTGTTIEYSLDGSFTCLAKDLQPYKKETMDNRKYNVEEYLKVWEETEKGLEVVVNDKFELKEDNGKFYIIKKQLQFPKTYEECLQILDFGDYDLDITYVTREEYNLHTSFIKLKRCRDAYWKIAGDWKPNWTNTNSNKHCIYYVGDEIKKQPMLEVHHFLAFPTEEMRDAFYENFNKEIEMCKELL